MIRDWTRVKELLAEAASLDSGPERKAYLDLACAGEPELRAELEKLLRAHTHAGDFLEPPFLNFPPAFLEMDPPRTEQIGDFIGPYKLIRQIGEGGCGVVYMAEQDHPFRRRVALKVIKLGMDTKSVIARFEAERQALALMDHPGIATVLDAGATGAGRPYFVMELVQGIKITQFCDQHQMSIEQRLHLFVQVCHALQHAHQKGIIHRDIKPSNILVTIHEGVPLPKVIDFGIAKATAQRLTEKTLITASDQLMGTPAYMSPEQTHMGAIDVDTRSDVYGLGVLLYELLTGCTPFGQKELAAAGPDDMRRIIREQEPVRPSTRVTTVKAPARERGGSEPRRGIEMISSDLDWIVMRCLEKDRTRRYGTALSLADDVQRHLNNEPVVACPPSRIYRLRKLVRRNQAAFLSGAFIALALVAGLGFSLWALGNERAARRQALASELKAQAETAKSREVAGLLKEMLQGVGPSAALGRDTTMLREILDHTAERIGRGLKDQPEVEAELRMTLGQVYYALGDFDKAEEMSRDALRIRRSLWGNMNTNVADSLQQLGWHVLCRKSDLAEGSALLQEALLIRTNLLGPEHMQIASLFLALGEARMFENKPREAEALFRSSLRMQKRLAGSRHADVAETLSCLSAALSSLGKLDAAEQAVREALAILSRLPKDERTKMLLSTVQIRLSGVLAMEGKREEAVQMAREAVALARRTYGNEHPNVAIIAHNLGVALIDANQLEEAETVVREALDLTRRTLGEDQPRSAWCLESLGEVMRKTGRLAEAETAFRQSLAIWEQRHHSNADALRIKLVTLLREERKFAEIEVIRRTELEAARKSRDPQRLWTALRFMGEYLVEQGRFDEAGPFFREAVEQVGALPPSDASLRFLLQLIQLYCREGRVAEAAPLLEDALKIADGLPRSAALAELVWFRANQVAVFQVWLGKTAESAATRRRAVQWAMNQPGAAIAERGSKIVTFHPLADTNLLHIALVLARRATEIGWTNGYYPWYQLSLGMAEYRNGHYTQAERTLAETVRGGTNTYRPQILNGTADYYRVMCLAQQGKLKGAQQLFLESEARMKPFPAVNWPLAGGVDHDDLVLWLAYIEAKNLLAAPAP
jgi:serine/threonine protein kinase/Tfp pilus assembly protein PilF